MWLDARATQQNDKKSYGDDCRPCTEFMLEYDEVVEMQQRSKEEVCGESKLTLRVTERSNRT